MRSADVVAAARAWVGTPYRHRASKKGVGSDCVGVVRGVWRELVGPERVALPAYAPNWAEAGGEELLLTALSQLFVPIQKVSQGAVLVFRWRRGVPAKHTGIAVSEDRFIHAYDGAGQVVEGPLVPFWRRRIVGVFAFPGVTD
ncbi:MAG: peptidase P60 [Devosia sp.]